MIFYPVDTLWSMRFSTKTQTLIDKRVRKITRPDISFLIFQLLSNKKIDLLFCFRHCLYALVFYMQVQFLFVKLREIVWDV